uniref:Uncharacterized protein n=1 Tax=Glossina pallidipes TaxID=7398 RepID=A0A1B0A4M8_GLOPL
MLGSFMEEMQITPEQFEMACLEGKDQHVENPYNFHQVIAKSVDKEMESAEAALTPESVEDNEQNALNDKFQRLNLFFEKNSVSPHELLTRQEYLKEQRDKIVEIKKRTRAKQLRETVSCNGAVKSNTVLEQPEECETNNALQLRKTLAKRLKAEVVEQN